MQRKLNQRKKIEEDGKGDDDGVIKPQTTTLMSDEKRGGEHRILYRNKQRVLVFAARGITQRYRHLMEDLRLLLPHHKTDVKLDSKNDLQEVNEICEMKSCNSCIFFECRKHKDLFMWAARTPNGPSVKFHVLNVHTMSELKLTGNSMMGSRPMLTFDVEFDSQPHLKLIKKLFSQIFGTPKGHPKSKPFVDRVMGFYLVDNNIWVRNYQVIYGTKAQLADDIQGIGKDTSLIEIGPRFVLNPVRVFDGSFHGQTLYQNAACISPNVMRREKNREHSNRYQNQVAQTKDRLARAEDNVMAPDPLEDVFDGFDGM